MHPDRAVHSIINNDNPDSRPLAHGRRHLLPIHEEAAIACECKDGALRMSDGRSDGGRNSVTHRPIGGSELGGELTPLQIAVNPNGIVASAVGDDGIRRQPAAQQAHQGVHGRGAVGVRV